VFWLAVGSAEPIWLVSRPVTSRVLEVGVTQCSAGVSNDDRLFEPGCTDQYGVRLPHPRPGLVPMAAAGLPSSAKMLNSCRFMTAVVVWVECTCVLSVSRTGGSDFMGFRTSTSRLGCVPWRVTCERKSLCASLLDVVVMTCPGWAMLAMHHEYGSSKYGVLRGLTAAASGFDTACAAQP
jgi:hypothetical protein